MIRTFATFNCITITFCIEIKLKNIRVQKSKTRAKFWDSAYTVQTLVKKQKNEVKLQAV